MFRVADSHRRGLVSFEEFAVFETREFAGMPGSNAHSKVVFPSAKAGESGFGGFGRDVGIGGVLMTHPARRGLSTRFPGL